MNMKIASEGYFYILGLMFFGLFMFSFRHPASDVAGWVSVALGIFCMFFFRDPERQPPEDPRFILSPGDGRVMEVVEEPHPYFNGKVKVVRIFLSIFDVHIQHAPISGRVSKIEYKKGKFLDARDPMAAHQNECNSIAIENAQCKVVVKQIAGLIARRIVCKVSVGENLRVGQKLGLIRFGSQVDLYLPLDLEICVAKGDRVVSGVSVIAMNKKIMGKKP